MRKELAEGVRGRFAGAIKQYDTDDVLTEEHIDEAAEKAAEMFASTAVSRWSQFTLDELTE